MHELAARHGQAHQPDFAGDRMAVAVAAAGAEDDDLALQGGAYLFFQQLRRGAAIVLRPGKQRFHAALQQFGLRHAEQLLGQVVGVDEQLVVDVEQQDGIGRAGQDGVVIDFQRLRVQGARRRGGVGHGRVGLVQRQFHEDLFRHVARIEGHLDVVGSAGAHAAALLLGTGRGRHQQQGHAVAPARIAQPHAGRADIRARQRRVEQDQVRAARRQFHAFIDVARQARTQVVAVQHIQQFAHIVRRIADQQHIGPVGDGGNQLIHGVAPLRGSWG